MKQTVTSCRFRNLLIPALLLLAVGSLTRPVRAQIVTTSTLTAADGAANDDLGSAVSVSGNYLAVSAPNKTVNGNTGQGAVYIYTLSGSTWTQTAEIIAADGFEFEGFGTTICLSGNILAVSGSVKINTTSYQGVVYIYTRSGTTWTQTAEITSSDEVTNDSFGASVSLNGTSLAIGAPTHSVNGNEEQGAVYIFAHSGSSWVQKAEITAADGVTGDNFGFSVSLGGTTLAVGAPFRYVNDVANQGTTYVYVHAGTQWNQQAELTASDGMYLDMFGYSLSLSGAILIVGTPYHSPTSDLPDQGAVYIYIRTGTTWTQQAELTAADGTAYDYFGYSVSFSGTTLAVGSPVNTVNGNSEEGVVYTYLHSGPNWILQQELDEPGGASGDEFGYSVSLNGSVLAVGANVRTVNGNYSQGDTTVFVTGQAALTATGGAPGDYMGYSVSLYSTTLATGAPGKKVSGHAYQGAVFVYSHSGTTWSQQAELTAADGAAYDEYGISVSVNGNTLVVSAPSHTVNGNPYAGAVYVYTLSGTTWTLQAELTAKDAASGDNFGYAVSLNASTLAVGAPYHTVGSNSHEGAVYLFTRSGTIWTQKAELTAQDGVGSDEFGYSVSLTSTSLAVGAPFHEVGSTVGQGAAYVFFRNNNVWSQSGEITASDGGSDDYFGSSVGLESTATEGSTLLVGAPYHAVGGTSYQQGAVYSFFAPTIPRWVQTAELIAPDGVSGDYFGASLSLNGTGLIIGAPFKAIDGNLEQGAAYTYSETGSGSTTGWTNTSELTAKDGKTDDLFGYSVCVIGTLYGIGAPEHKVKSYSDQGVVYTLP